MNLILIFCGTVVVLVMALMTLIVVRSLYQFAVSDVYEEGGMFYSFLYATTEPVISPVRSVLSRTKLFDSLPIDLSSIFTWILLMLVRMILTSI